jgi:hypothetical protein
MMTEIVLIDPESNPVSNAGLDVTVLALALRGPGIHDGE